MSPKILAGPLLGLEGDTIYTICFLSNQHTAAPEVVVDDITYPATRVQSTPSGVF